ncbi:hypothetical protein CP061683_2461 [Chlamydia psittaci 06-1683]|nr:hypothetical protein CP061683_2461 [Chlamydia psittaci 06-1683]
MPGTDRAAPEPAKLHLHHSWVPAPCRKAEVEGQWGLGWIQERTFTLEAAEQDR